VIIDFGAARDFQARHSRSITAIATAGYAPPEQYGVGDGQQGPWSDLYALGAIAYWMVSGVPPADSLRRLRKDPLVPAVVTGAGSYDANFLRTIDWMLKIDEEDRPVSVAQVRKALRGPRITEPDSEFGRAVLDQKSKAAPANDDLSQISGKSRSASSRIRNAAVAVGLMLFVGFGAVSYSFFTLQEKQSTPQAAKKQQSSQLAEGQSPSARIVPSSTPTSMTDQINSDAPKTPPHKIKTIAIRKGSDIDAPGAPLLSENKQQWSDAIDQQAVRDAHYIKTFPVRSDPANNGSASPGVNALQLISPDVAKSMASSSEDATRRGLLVWVASQRNEADARAAFRVLQEKFPTLLGSHPVVIKRIDLGGEKGVFYRGLVGPFVTSDEASQFCRNLVAAGGNCFIPQG
jgi:hypothetical protein